MCVYSLYSYQFVKAMSHLQVSDVSRAVQTLARMLAPLEWPYTLVGLLPDSKVELCYCPTPYLAGM